MRLRAALALLASSLLLGPAAGAQNLLVNGDFDVDTAGWSCEMEGAVCAWSEDDSADDPSSGSGEVLREGPGDFRGQLVQCVALPGGGLYSVAAVLRTISENRRSGQLDVAWFGEEACEGSELRRDIIDAVPFSTWTPIEDVLLAPADAVSLEYRVIAFATEEESQTVRVDAAFVPEPGAAASGLVALGVLGALRGRRPASRRDGARPRTEAARGR